MTNNENDERTKKEQISDFKKKTDVMNKELYSDIKSFRFGFVIIIAVVSIILLYLYLSNR